MGSVVVDEVNQTISFVDVTITFPFGGNMAQSKVGTITISGANGVSNIMLGLEGSAGVPSPPSAVIVNQIEYDATPADPVVTVLDPGGPGTPADWTLTIEVNKGAPGDDTEFAFLDATDLTGTATAGYTITYSADTGSGDPGVVWTPVPKSVVKWPTSVSSTASSSTSPRPLASVSVTAGEIPYNTRPVVHGYCVVTGSSDVRVDLVAYLGDPDSGGKEIARCPGVALGTAGFDRLLLIPGYPTTHTSSDGLLPAGTAGSVYLRAINVGNASANWATSDTSTRLWVEFVPV